MCAILAGAVALVNACASVSRVGPATQERAWRTYLGSLLRAPGPGESLNVNPQPVWRAVVGRGIIGAPAVTEDVIAISQVDRQVVLLDRSTGDVIWRRRLSDHLGSGPLVEDDRVFVATQDGDGRAFALQLATGKPIWSAPVGGAAVPLVLADAALYAASLEGWVSRLSPSTGGRQWRTRVPGAVRAAPVPTPAGLVVATAADSMFLLSLASGEVRARRGTRGAVLAAPALADSVLLVGTTAGKLMALDPATLATRWERDVETGVVGAIAVREGVAYVLTLGGALWRVPLDAPQRAEATPLGVVARAGPAPVAGGVLITGVNGEIALVSRSGARGWNVRLDGPVSEPVIVDGRMVLAVSERGEVVAFR